jgi:hypothetical protein
VFCCRRRDCGLQLRDFFGGEIWGAQVGGVGDHVSSCSRGRPLLEVAEVEDEDVDSVPQGWLISEILDGVASSQSHGC